jgi:hypothetical protein
MLSNAKIVTVVSIDKKITMHHKTKVISCNILPCDPSYATSIVIGSIQYITTFTLVHR